MQYTEAIRATLASARWQAADPQLIAEAARLISRLDGAIYGDWHRNERAEALTRRAWRRLSRRSVGQWRYDVPLPPPDMRPRPAPRWFV